MRRELLVFIETSEKDVEISVKGTDSKGDTILFNYEGNKFIVSASDLQDALSEIKAFQIRNSEEVTKIDATAGSLTFFEGNNIIFSGEEN